MWMLFFCLTELADTQAESALLFLISQWTVRKLQFINEYAP